MAYTLADVTDDLFVNVIKDALWSADDIHSVVVERLDDFDVTEEDIRDWLRYEELPKSDKQLLIINHLEPDIDYQAWQEEDE